MSIATTDDLYNAASRCIEQKLSLYLDATPLDVTKDNYLISTSVLEEAYAIDTNSPFGKVTSNELTVTLLNEGSIFSPTNAQSPYFGKMRKGVKAVLYIRPVSDTDEEYEWDKLGTYYVTDWNAVITGLTATVVLNDSLFDAFGVDISEYIIRKDVTQKQFYTDIFQMLSLRGEVDDSLVDNLRYAYINDSAKGTLSELGAGCLTACYCTHAGDVKVKSLVADSELRAVLTDSDQLIEAKITDSIDTTYDCVEVIYSMPQESEATKLLSAADTHIVGDTTLKDLYWTKKPLVRLDHTSIVGMKDAFVSSISATPTRMSCMIRTPEYQDGLVNFEVYGTVLDNTQVSISTDGNSILSISNKYIHNSVQAERVLRHLQAYINNRLATLELTVRGNPRLELCDKIRVVSEKYNLDYTGLIIKQTFNYSGSLSSTLTLLNAEILQEVLNGL